MEYLRRVCWINSRSCHLILKGTNGGILVQSSCSQRGKRRHFRWNCFELLELELIVCLWYQYAWETQGYCCFCNILHSPLHSPSHSYFQLRRLKERSKTEMSSRRVSWAEQSRGRRTSPWCGGLFHPSGLPKEYGQKQAHYQSKEIFQDMLVNIRGAGVEREHTPVSDREEYFSDAWNQ